MKLFQSRSAGSLATLLPLLLTTTCAVPPEDALNTENSLAQRSIITLNTDTDADVNVPYVQFQKRAFFLTSPWRIRYLNISFNEPLDQPPGQFGLEFPVSYQYKKGIVWGNATQVPDSVFKFKHLVPLVDGGTWLKAKVPVYFEWPFNDGRIECWIHWIENFTHVESKVQPKSGSCWYCGFKADTGYKTIDQSKVTVDVN